MSPHHVDQHLVLDLTRPTPSVYERRGILRLDAPMSDGWNAIIHRPAPPTAVSVPLVAHAGSSGPPRPRPHHRLTHAELLEALPHVRGGMVLL